MLVGWQPFRHLKLTFIFCPFVFGELQLFPNFHNLINSPTRCVGLARVSPSPLSGAPFISLLTLLSLFYCALISLFFRTLTLC